MRLPMLNRNAKRRKKPHVIDFSAIKAIDDYVDGFANGYFGRKCSLNNMSCSKQPKLNRQRAYFGSASVDIYAVIVDETYSGASVAFFNDRLKKKVKASPENWIFFVQDAFSKNITSKFYRGLAEKVLEAEVRDPFCPCIDDFYEFNLSKEQVEAAIDYVLYSQYFVRHEALKEVREKYYQAVLSFAESIANYYTLKALNGHAAEMLPQTESAGDNAKILIVCTENYEQAVARFMERKDMEQPATPVELQRKDYLVREEFRALINGEPSDIMFAYNLALKEGNVFMLMLASQKLEETKVCLLPHAQEMYLPKAKKRRLSWKAE